MSENDIVSKVLKVPTIKLVNSIGLQQKLKSHGCKSYIVRPGYDIDKYYPMGIRENSRDVVIGGLYNSNRHNQVKRTGWIWETTFKLKSIRKDLKLWFFGDHKKPEGHLIDHYIRRPTLEEKNVFYNHINIWLAPTGLEGLHMPPAEAMLTGCPVIGTNSKMNGMQEYLIHMKTGIVTKNKMVDFIEKTRELLDNRELQIELGKNAREEVLKIGSRHENMGMFIKLLKRLKNEDI
jgi:glycosyltransferase involved in cell wall biosynthesis